MNAADRLWDLITERGDATLEFVRDGYRLTVNPVKDRIDEVGFIVWREDDRGPEPIVTGRAKGKSLLVDDPGSYNGTPTQLSALVEQLLDGEPVPTPPPGDPNSAVPTAT